MGRAFLVLGAISGFMSVAAGAFGSHALRAKLPPERLSTFEIAVRYQLWHALALFAVVVIGSAQLGDGSAPESLGWQALVAGWSFVAGTILFCGSLYALTLTGERRWGAVAPIGGACFLLGWAALALAALTV
jgi:uncharacterized membrane protein YgdD (TMEM256/DUF423 family)